MMRRSLQRGVRYCSSAATEEVLVQSSSTTKLVTINRPKALNALNLSTVRELTKLYTNWLKSGEDFMIVIRGSGGKAFCAGGDIVSIATDEEGSLKRDFFLEEYKLNYAIKTFPNPHIAILDGITMGGGVGLSVHGSHRVVTENTLFAMPETGIGLFPDVGGSIFLPRMPHAGLGMYLALTGHRLKGADCLHATIGTHYVKSANIQALQNELLATVPSKADEVLKEFSESLDELPAFSLQDSLDRISRTFTLGSLNDIMEDLRRTDDEWSEKTLKILSRMSPTSLRITHEQLTRGARQTPEENFAMEANMVYGSMNYSGDFKEGVRALLLDKDKSPKWNPATLQEATPEIISRFFETRPDKPWVPTKLTASL
eukprot:TRINITY_DN1338_c0_g1_i1.p1 TRINITY_DN1338_c0_g1~~TRINITY_DN1338_c0_g1_i1.p1  ORF type:complete len:372 (+),score=72.57 TRINITY_DN1338_c0_g1_i1:46-1161(+)